MMPGSSIIAAPPTRGRKRAQPEFRRQAPLPNAAGRMSGVTADHTSVIRSRWDGKAGMSDTGHKLTWINAIQPLLPLISRAFGPAGSEKADVMATLHRTTNLAPFSASRAQLARRARELRRFGDREAAPSGACPGRSPAARKRPADPRGACVAGGRGQSPRRPDTATASDHGTGPRRPAQQEHRRGSRHQPTHGREPSRGDHEKDRIDVSSGVGPNGACRCLG